MDIKNTVLWGRGLIGLIVVLAGVAAIFEGITLYMGPTRIIIGLIFLALGIWLVTPFVKKVGWLKTCAVAIAIIIAIPIIGYLMEAEERKQADLKDIIEREMSTRLDKVAEIKSVSVIQGEGNNYRGLITAEDERGQIKISLDIVYDGDRFIYDIRNSGRVE